MLSWGVVRLCPTSSGILHPAGRTVGRLHRSPTPLLAMLSAVIDCQSQPCAVAAVLPQMLFLTAVVSSVFHTTLCQPGRTRPLQVYSEVPKSPKMSYGAAKSCLFVGGGCTVQGSTFIQCM